MPLIYVTGPTEAGKSTIREKLRELGYDTYDIDDEGMREPQTIDGKQLLGLSSAKMRQLRDEADLQAVFLCGTAPNDQDYADLFDKVFVLVVDEVTQRARIENRTNSQYGKSPPQLDTAIKWREPQIEKYTAMGAIAIDATAPVDEITDMLMRHI